MRTASVIAIVDTSWNCVFYYLDQCCFYIADWFIVQIVDLCTDQDVFTWYISSPWDSHHCWYWPTLETEQAHILLCTICAWLLKQSNMYPTSSCCWMPAELYFLTTKTKLITHEWKAGEWSVSCTKRKGDTDADWPASIWPHSLLRCNMQPCVLV